MMRLAVGLCCKGSIQKNSSFSSIQAVGCSAIQTHATVRRQHAVDCGRFIQYFSRKGKKSQPNHMDPGSVPTPHQLVCFEQLGNSIEHEILPFKTIRKTGENCTQSLIQSRQSSFRLSGMVIIHKLLDDIFRIPSYRFLDKPSAIPQTLIFSYP